LRRLVRPRFDLPARSFIGQQFVFVLVHIALLQILKAEIRAEETSRAILDRDPLISADGRTSGPDLLRVHSAE
jgi:hypothetical protein